MFCKFNELFCVLAFLLGTIKAAPLTSTKTITTTQQSQPTHAQLNAPKFNFQWTPRTAWHAAPPRHITPINSAVSGEHDGGVEGTTTTGAAAAAPAAAATSSGVPYVIIHHTATRRCEITESSNNANFQTCHAILRAIQHSHQSDHGWDDIGYNFLIGGNGHDKAEIYEGRGFNVSGAHTRRFNARSIGIALIGNWTDTLPPEAMLQKLKELISYGVEADYIKSNYKLFGHRQLSATECPGTRLYNELKNWPHFNRNPSKN